MQSKDLDRIFIGLGHDIQCVRAGIDHWCTDNSHLDQDVSVFDNAFWQWCSERLLPALRTAIGMKRVNAIVGWRHKENVVCTAQHLDIGHVERLSKHKSVPRHTE